MKDLNKLELTAKLSPRTLKALVRLRLETELNIQQIVESSK